MNPLRKRYKAAVRYYDKGKYKKCIELLDVYLKRVDFNYEALLYKARSYYMLGDYRKALVILKMLLGFHPDTIRILPKIGEMHYRLKEYQEAKSYLEQCLKIDRYSIRSNYFLACIYYELEDYKRAIEYFTNTLNLEHNSFESDGFNIYLNRAHAYYFTEEYDKALDDIVEAEKYKSELPRLYLLRGTILSIKEEIIPALENIQHAMALDTENGIICLRFAQTVGKLNKYDPIFSDYFNSVKLEPLEYRLNLEGIPDNIAQHLQRGYKYYKNNELKLAIEEYTKCIELNPNSVEPYKHRGLCYIKISDFEKAYSDFDEAMVIEPNDYTIYINHAVGNIRNKIYADAIVALIDAKRLGNKEAAKIIEDLRGILNEER